jgi:hypothetical protein
MLTPFYALGYYRVNLVEFLFVEGDTLPSLRQNGFVFVLRDFGLIITFLIAAIIMPALAGVAYKRRAN